jgi:hypothetical protein
MSPQGARAKLLLGAAYTEDFASDSLSDSLSYFMQVGSTSDSLSDMKIERLHTNTIFHPIPCPIPCCL